MSNNTPPKTAADEDPVWDAVGRFLSGESSAQEAALLTARLDGHPDEAALISALSDALELATVKADTVTASAINVEAALASVHAKIALEGDAQVRSIRSAAKLAQSKLPPSRRYGSPRMRLAAVAAVALAAFGVQRWQKSLGNGSGGTSVSYATAVGARQSIKLADGSDVMLAPGSRLVVAADFKSGERNVTLEGAAYFHVVHDGAHPFAVHAGTAVIRDIGTAFSVKTVGGSAVYVAVREGAVALTDTSRKSSQAVELRAGDRGVATVSDGVTAQRGAAASSDALWNADSLVFRDATWSEVQTDLRRWYGVQLVVSDTSLVGRTVTNTSGMNDSGQYVLKVLASMFGAELQYHGDTAILVRSRGKLRP